MPITKRVGLKGMRHDRARQFKRCAHGRRHGKNRERSASGRLVGRWLMVRSDAPGMDVVTVLCKARGYIARQEELEWRS
jgi:hypothetical protein